MDLFNFRVVRPIQVKQASVFDSTSILNTDEVGLGNAITNDQAKAYQATVNYINPHTWANWLQNFSLQLALQDDLVAPADCIAKLPTGPPDWATQAAAPAWSNQNLQLVNSLAASFVLRDSASVEGLSRLIVVQELVSMLAVDAGKNAADKVLQTAQDVQNQITWKKVLLPSNLFSKNLNAYLARKPGFIDYFVVKDEWNRYEPAQLAQVINVLAGETFETQIRHSVETNTMTSTSTSTTTSQQTTQSQTTSNSLSQTSTQNASLNIGAQGQVEVSTSFGPTSVKTSLGGQVQSSRSQSDSQASTMAYQTVQQSVKSFSQTVVQAQSARTITRDSTYDDHKLENQTNAVNVGLYCWLNEIHRVALERYPHRYVLEFQIPEPGSWLRYALQNPPNTGWDNPDPGPFILAGKATQLSPTDIDATTVNTLVQQWKIQGLVPPPPDTVILSVKLTSDPNSTNTSSGSSSSGSSIAVVSDATLTVPSGYQADTWTADYMAARNWQNKNYGTQLQIVVGGSGASDQGSGDLGQSPGGDFCQGSVGKSQVGSINTGAIPVSAYAMALNGFVCNVNVTCSLMPEALAQWQVNTFSQVVAAYENLVAAHQRERDTRNQQLGIQTTLSGPPLLNQARAVNELRRLVIQNLLGRTFNGNSDITYNNVTGEPNVDLKKTFDDAPTIQFLEQVFEWENLIYICYPYYWADRSKSWVTYATSATTDPQFDAFLNAGSARVTVPARPGFEDVLNYFLYTGEPWDGRSPPAPNDPD